MKEPSTDLAQATLHFHHGATAAIAYDIDSDLWTDVRTGLRKTWEEWSKRGTITEGW